MATELLSISQEIDDSRNAVRFADVSTLFSVSLQVTQRREDIVFPEEMAIFSITQELAPGAVTAVRRRRISLSSL